MTDPAGGPQPEPSRLDDLLRHAGVDPRITDEARADGHLPLLAVEALARSEPPAHDLASVADASGMAPDRVRRIWRYLGFADVAPGDRVFTDGDIVVLSVIHRLIADGIVDEELVDQMSRGIGQATTRMASSFVDALEASVPADGATPEGEDRFALLAPMLLDTLSRINDNAWRRHVEIEARARITRDHAGSDPSHRVVGFADLVGFTVLSQQVDAPELARLVDRFERIVFDEIAAAGGRVVKTIGDEVMFALDDESPAADLAIRLAATFEADERMPDVRVGLAAGPVLQRDGDLFGPVVNRASRLVGLAIPGSVLVDETVHAALEHRPDLAWRSLGSRSLKNMGKVPIWVLRERVGSRPGHGRSSRR